MPTTYTLSDVALKAGEPFGHAPIRITLCDEDGHTVPGGGHVIGSPGEIIKTHFFHAHPVTGVFEVDLIANADITPANTCYKVTIGGVLAAIIQATADGDLALLEVTNVGPLGPPNASAAALAAEIAARIAADAVLQDEIDNLPGGGGGAVDSVNGQTGVVVLDAGDVEAVPSTVTDGAGHTSSASADAFSRATTVSDTDADTASTVTVNSDSLSLQASDGANQTSSQLRADLNSAKISRSTLAGEHSLEVTDSGVLVDGVQAATTDDIPDVSGFATSSDLTTETTARIAGDASSVSTAASDATSKANAAQAAAVQRANHTGTQSADTLTDGTTNKAYLATERTKLAGVATGATANDTDANLKNRANHTGTQLMATVSDATQRIRESAGPATWAQANNSMNRWAYSLQDSPTTAVKLVRLCDSYGSDFSAAWVDFDRVMNSRYRGGGYGGGYRPISTSLGTWATAQGSADLTKGIAGRAQTITTGQFCQETFFGDGVLFIWAANASSSATGLLLKVDGSTVQTVDGRTAGSYYYTFPNGYGTHVVRFESNSATNTVDGAYVYQGNRTAGLQIWDLSHTGYKTSDWVSTAETARALALIQPHGVLIATGTNDTSAAAYAADLASLRTLILANVTVAPSIGLYLNFSIRARVSDWADVVDAAKAFCIANGCGLIDLSRIIDPIGGSSGADPLALTGDGTHPSTKTKRIISEATLRLFEIAPLDWGSARQNGGIMVTTAETTYTLHGDEDTVQCTAATAVTFNIPQPFNLLTAGAGFALGRVIRVVQSGAGAITLTATSGNVRCAQGLTTTSQYSVIELVATGILEWTATIVAAPIQTTLVDAKGDLLAGTADNTVGRLAVGANRARLIADSSASTGLSYEAAPVFKRKTGNTSRNTTIVPAGDPDLTTTALVISAVYQFTCVLIHQGLAADDLRIQFAVPSGATFDITSIGAPTNVSAVPWVPTGRRFTTSTIPLGTIDGSTPVSSFLTGIVVMSTNTGTFELQWSQNSSSGTDVTLLAGSWMLLERVA